MNDQPALSLLLLIGLLQFWLMPGIAWALLKDNRDLPAHLWFSGTACYATAVTLFAIQSRYPTIFTINIALSLVVLMLALFAESLRLELQQGPTRWRVIFSAVALNSALLAGIQSITDVDFMRAVQLALVSLLDAGLCVLLWLVIRKTNSKALWFVLVGVSVVIIANLLRIKAYVTYDEAPHLMSFSASSNFGFIANYLSVVVYSFGYWGFVIEKNRSALVSEISARVEAQFSETEAINRERLTKELLLQREALIEELAKAQRVAQATAVTASIAHEINQPLASLQLIIDHLMDLHRTGANTEEITQMLARAALEQQRVATMIRRVRDVFSRRGTQIESRLVDALVEDACRLMQRRADEKGIVLKRNFAAPVSVHIGAGELEHVLLNLVTNAIDALCSANKEYPVVTISTTIDQGSVLINVQDNGPGVSAHVGEQVFELFSGLNSGGMGVGLWLSRHIVQRHGGDIWLDPRPKQGGASFTARLQINRDSSGALHPEP